MTRQIDDKEMVLSLIVLLTCFTPCFTKPLGSEILIPRGQIIYSHQLRDRDSQPQGNVFQPEESISKESDVTSRVEEFLNRHVAHNRTARDVNNPCFDHLERKWDPCRQKVVHEVHCFLQHVACYRAMDQGYSYPACQVVFGYRQAKYISKCTALQIDCQCAS